MHSAWTPQRMFGAVTMMLAFSACAGNTGLPSDNPSPKELVQGIQERAGLILENDVYGDSATRLVYLDQGWNPLETLWFYHADQGSVLMPYETLIHLEQADNDKLFIQPEHLARFRFLNQRPTPNNPDGLPVGFSRHEDKVGLTCAACHTTQINYRGTAMRIDGAQGIVDVMQFMQAVEAALAATLADEAKLARFAATSKKEQSLDEARKELTATHAWFKSYSSANVATVPEGFGRMDAVGRILNQVIRFTSDPSNSLPLGAPASMPVIWDTPRHDYVQWTAFAPNAGPGSLGRNIGEVMGVYGYVEVKHYETEEEAKKGYPSTVNASELVAMEEAVRKLQSPQWPETILPAIDRTQAARGEALYQTSCVSCHALIERDNPRRKVTAMVTGIDVVGTDPTAARTVAEAMVPSGKLEGAISPKGEKYGAQVPALDLISDLPARVLATQTVQALKAVANAKLHGIESGEKQGNYTRATEAQPKADLLSYKARPLNGVWASSPYLHNGSVPTLHDLLQPPASRPAQFSTGRLEYDPVKVGYVSDGDGPFRVDTTLKGNSNQGHLYGTQLSDADRLALLEYLKTL